MATVSLHHVDASLDGYRQQRGSGRTLLARAGINPATLDRKAGRVHTDQVGRLFRLIQQDLNDEFMGFSHKPCKYGAFNTLCSLTRDCKTLGELLRRAVELYNLVTDDITMALNSNQNLAKFSFTINDSAQDTRHFLAEFLLVIWHRFPSWYIAEAIRLREIHFVHDAPEYLKELTIMYPGELRFNQPEYGFVFDSGYLKNKLRRKREELSAFLSTYPQEIMAIPGFDSSVEAQVEHTLADHPADTLVFPQAHQIATTLGMAKVTLFRRLKKEGTSYQKIKDNVRRERAIELLIGDDVSVDGISEIVGFSEARSFTRAFRSWTGLSPRQYRKLHRQG